ncbi:MAG TPA: aldo/keto reductase [Ilumatobacteraceae bacterium]|nr:aldo/keto reductase [Ilumatobacteraceae bacterium]
MNAMNQLPRVPLGRTGLEVTRLGLGTAPLATVFWGNAEDRAVATAERAIEVGIRLFDSAPLYGLGESETRLGRALQSIDRDDVVVATKAGRSLAGSPDVAEGVEAEFDFSHDATLQALESSLERLGLDRIDIVHIHDPEEHLAEAIDGTYAALDRLRREGTVGAVSVGTNFVETARFFLRNADLDCVMVAGRLTLLDRSAADLVPDCRRAGVAYLAAGVFNSGVLADPKPGSWFDYAPAPPDVLERAAAIRATCEAHGVSLPTAALHYPLTVDGVTAVIVGMSSPTEVDDNVTAFQTTIPPALWTDLASL